MDVLSSVLRELRLESATYRSLRLRAPWRLEFDGGLRGVHVFVRGTGVLSVDGQEPLTLRAGDLVVLPRADSHVMSSPGAPDSPALSTLELARRTQGNEILLGGPGEPTTIMCGAFFFGDEDHPAVAGFPRCIHVPARPDGAPDWLTSVTQALTREITDSGAGSEIIMARLSDALVTRALRHHLETADEPGWLRGLRDAYVTRALAALHADLAAPWTVRGLAHAAGLSRSAFSARFADALGQPPMVYFFQCRVRHAMTLLRTEHGTSASVATRVGYGSEAAFSAAFARHTGITPGAYRRRAGQRRQMSHSGVP
ncbi:MAG: AraC family transcriptional regulator [Frankiaceae bacterium]